MKESDLLGWLYQKSQKTPAVPVPVGDDMAGVRLPGGARPLVLLKIDQCLDQVHFDLRRHTPSAIGRKAVNRCLSDCAAMAAIPTAIMVAVALPKDISLSRVRAIYHGCQAAAGVFNCPIVGGDTAIWNQRLAITVAALGMPESLPTLRSAARPGDALCVTGPLGGSILGRHLNFVPRIQCAQRLVHAARIHAMMDISDGLAIDLPRLLALSRVGAIVHADAIPVHPDARRLARSDGRTPLHHALCDGEDYELLLTLPPREALRLAARRFPVHLIGSITRSAGRIDFMLDNRRRPWPRGGWNHGAVHE